MSEQTESTVDELVGQNERVVMIDMTKDDYIKKLERRIHNQRVALRENWMIVEMRRNEYCGKLRPLRSKWWGYVKKLNAEIRRLKQKCGES